MRLACCLVAAATAALPPSPAAPPPDAELELAELRKHAPRPRCTHWNESTALKHELAFEQCVAPTAEKNMRDQLLVNGSAPLSGIAQLLLFTYPEEVCKCTLKLENAVTCSKYSSAHAILQVYQPWCWMLAECGHMAQALLRAAYLCNTAGMSGNDTTALCKDDGANGCALATENLFGATHAETWVNDTELLQTLHVPISYAIGRRLEARRASPNRGRPSAGPCGPTAPPRAAAAAPGPSWPSATHPRYCTTRGVWRRTSRPGTTAPC